MAMKVSDAKQNYAIRMESRHSMDRLYGRPAMGLTAIRFHRCRDGG